jgi:hypothetical protein
MGLKFNLENATFVFSIIRGEGGITVLSRPSRLCCLQGVIHYLRLLTGTTQAVLPPLWLSCCLFTCVPYSCLRAGKQNENSVVTDWAEGSGKVFTFSSAVSTLQFLKQTQGQLFLNLLSLTISLEIM